MESSFFDFREQMSKEARPEPPAANRRGDDRAILSVTQLTARIERAIKDGFPTSVLVRGQVSNYKRHGTSGHAYFTLKDASCCVECALWKSDAVKLKFQPEDGMELLATARMGVYGQRGRYQLYVSRLEPLGQGALEIAFAQLKSKLQAEGLFAPDRKRPIPRYPLRIALLTGQGTAALADMLKVLERFRWLRLWVYPVPVQGTGAAEKIAQALAHLDATHRQIGGIDVLLLGRGGGSLEDLWAFNEEAVARAIAACSIPVVTGIGHEVDLSIADLVADHHAHTPTEAAAVVAAGWRGAADDIDLSGVRARRALRNLVQERRQWLSGIRRHEIIRRPAQRIDQLRQGIDDRQRELGAAVGEQLRRRRERLAELRLALERNRPSAIVARLRQTLEQIRQRLESAQRTGARDAAERLARLATLLREGHPRHGANLARVRLIATQRRLRAAGALTLSRAGTRVAALARHLNAVGPAQVLKRGYTITTLKRGGVLLRSAGRIRAGDRMITRFADGTVESTADDPNQPGLFE